MLILSVYVVKTLHSYKFVLEEILADLEICVN